MIRRLWRCREQIYPYVLGAAFFVSSIFYSNSLGEWAKNVDIDISEFFSAMFNVASILTAFLFSFFGMSIAPGGGFIAKIFGTKTFRLFTRYIVESLILGSSLAVLSIPFMVADLIPSSDFSWQMWLAAIWSFFAISAMLSFYRVASVFVIWIRVGSRTLHASNKAAAPVHE